MTSAGEAAPALSAHARELPSRPGRTVRLSRGEIPLTWAEVLVGLRTDTTFRTFFARTIADNPYRALFWEAAPVSAGTLGRVYEQALLYSPALVDAPPHPEPFEQELARARDGVALFANLGGDAELVVPARAGASESHAHLAAFVRGAPPGQVDALFRVVGEALDARLARSPAPVWVSTSGLGVSWVHVRLDARPKYYSHAPYRAFEAR